MAILDTQKSKEFIAGAPSIILKGDHTNKKIASAPGIDDSRNELSMQLFGKPLKLLTPEEMDMLNDEAERLMQKFMADGGRAQYGLGSLVKSVGKAVKGVVKGVTGTVKKNPILALAALNFAPMLLKGGASTFLGGSNPMFTLGQVGSFFTGGSKAANALKIGGAGAVITGLLAGRMQQEGESDIDYAKRRAEVNDQLKVQFSRLYPKEDQESDSDYSLRISAMVDEADDQTVDVGNMAEGGRVMRALGSDELVEQASGIEGLPININSKGVKELDMRETGGFIPPVGIKEKADDIPAMLSNNEFVFTADAVRAAGGGSVDKGAQVMYDTMKRLESKVG
tara:strand:+ start:404 stop:1420 length:1017 start_codon:yes stop_codon:yes gene_type:complete